MTTKGCKRVWIIERSLIKINLSFALITAVNICEGIVIATLKSIIINIWRALNNSSTVKDFEKIESRLKYTITPAINISIVIEPYIKADKANILAWFFLSPKAKYLE